VVPVKIAAISYRVPSLIMSNSDMIEMVDRLNPETSRLRKAIFFRTIDTLYGRLGAKTRHVRDVARKRREPPISCRFKKSKQPFDIADALSNHDAKFSKMRTNGADKASGSPTTAQRLASPTIFAIVEDHARLPIGTNKPSCEILYHASC
jgi:hypothetical protein